MKDIINAPWKAEQNSWQYTTISDNNGGTICQLDLEDWEVEEDNQERLEKQQADIAKLIAAAPDLLAALEVMVSKATKQDWNDAYPEELQQAFDAIAKATP